MTRYRCYPYGEAIGTQEWDKPQFATYTRDGSSGLDDAMNRQYDRIWGRFTAADPYEASADLEAPGTFNRYAYVIGDPLNFNDPEGLEVNVTLDQLGSGRCGVALANQVLARTNYGVSAQGAFDLFNSKEGILAISLFLKCAQTGFTERIRGGTRRCSA